MKAESRLFILLVILVVLGSSHLVSSSCSPTRHVLTLKEKLSGLAERKERMTLSSWIILFIPHNLKIIEIENLYLGSQKGLIHCSTHELGLDPGLLKANVKINKWFFIMCAFIPEDKLIKVRNSYLKDSLNITAESMKPFNYTENITFSNSIEGSTMIRNTQIFNGDVSSYFDIIMK